jgi:hypothetical protein
MRQQGDQLANLGFAGHDAGSSEWDFRTPQGGRRRGPLQEMEPGLGQLALPGRVGQPLRPGGENATSFWGSAMGQLVVEGARAQARKGAAPGSIAMNRELVGMAGIDQQQRGRVARIPAGAVVCPRSKETRRSHASIVGADSDRGKRHD